MTTRTVTGNIKTLTDSAVSSGVVTFEKVVTSTTGNTIHQFGTTTATTDGSGDFSIALAVPASGSYRYRMILPNGDAFYFSIASGASVNVATLIVAETITDSDAIVEALAAYLPLSGGTMTGQLNFSGTTHAGIKLLTLTTAQRDALTAANGMVIYNSTTTTVQVYQGGAWASVGSGGVAWGAITGTLSSQTDLQSALDAKQAADSDLTAIAGLSPSNDDIIQRKAGAWTNRTMAQLLADSGALPYDATLASIAALGSAANKYLYTTGADSWTEGDITAFTRTLLDDSDASTARTTLGLGTLATQSGTFSGGGVLATGGFTLTVPATGTAALLAVANVFTAAQMIDGTADAIQLRVQGHSTQTSIFQTWEHSGGNVIAAVTMLDTDSGRINIYKSGGIVGSWYPSGSTVRFQSASGYDLTFLNHGAELMRGTSLGYLGIGVSSSVGGKVDINQSSTTAAVPTLKLTQADVSEEFIRFVGTSANATLTQSIVEAADVGVATLAGYVKVYVQDDGNQLTDQAYFMPVYTLA